MFAAVVVVSLYVYFLCRFRVNFEMEPTAAVKTKYKSKCGSSNDPN